MSEAIAWTSVLVALVVITVARIAEHRRTKQLEQQLAEALASAKAAIEGWKTSVADHNKTIDSWNRTNNDLREALEMLKQK